MVLAFSPMPLLIDFGVVVALDVALALVSVLVVLPPLLRWGAAWIPAEEVVEAVDLAEEFEPELATLSSPSEVMNQ